MSFITSLCEFSRYKTKSAIRITLNNESDQPRESNPLDTQANQFIARLDDVSFDYGATTVLRHANLEVSSGQYLAITGDNGAGKSTIIKLLLGQITPQRGTVELFGQPTTSFKNWKKVGYLPQLDPNRSFPVTVRELVAMNLYSLSGPLRLPVKGGSALVNEALSYVDMLELADRKISDLSGGQARRAMIARSLVTSPELLLLDEPMAGLDRPTQRSLIGLLKKLNRERNTAIVMITHAPDDIADHIDRIVKVHEYHIDPYDHCLEPEKAR